MRLDLLIISGGKTGADLGAWRAARAFGLRTGGLMPLGFLTEDGPRPEFVSLYGAVKIPTPDYRMRTEANVRQSEATIWFGRTDTPGAKTTLNAIRGMGRPHMLVVPGRGVRPSDVAAWIVDRRFKSVNVAGNRESKAPGIGARVERFMGEVFRQLGYGQAGS
jgi:hypothetical protein